MPVLKTKANKKLQLLQKRAKRRHRQEPEVEEEASGHEMEGDLQPANEPEASSDGADDVGHASDADVQETDAPKPKRAKKRKSRNKKRKSKLQHPALGRFKPADDSIVGALWPMLTANELRSRNLGLRKVRGWLSTSAYSGVSMKAEDTLAAAATGQREDDNGDEQDHEGSINEEDELHGLSDANPVNAQGVELEPLEVDGFLQDNDENGPRQNYNEVTRKDMMKLWDGLFFHMWMSDKRGPQAELAHSMAQLLLQIRDVDLALLYASCFFAVMESKWGGIDRWRMNKFYDLLSRVTKAFFQFSVTHQRETPGDVIEDVVAVLARGPFRCIRDPNANLGPALHVASVLMPTLKAAGAAISVPIPAPIVHEYLDLVTTVITHNPHKLLVPKIMGAYSDAAALSDLVDVETGQLRPTGKALTSVSMDESDDDEEDEDDEEDDEDNSTARPKFLQLDPQHVCSALLDRASVPDLPVRRRKLLFSARRTVLTLCKRRGVDAEGPAVTLQDEQPVVSEGGAEAQEDVDEQQEEVEYRQEDEEEGEEGMVAKTKARRKKKQQKQKQQQQQRTTAGKQQQKKKTNKKGSNKQAADEGAGDEETKPQEPQQQPKKKQQQQKKKTPQHKKQMGDKAKQAQPAKNVKKGGKQVGKQKGNKQRRQ